MRIGENGDPYVEMSTLTRDEAVALREFVVDDYVGGRGENGRAVKKIRIKIRDKVPALIALGKHLGLFTR